MTQYPYCQNNLLHKPNTYMYTPFQGETLLQSYFSCRISVIRRYAEGFFRDSETDDRIVAYALPVFQELFRDISSNAGKELQEMLTSILQKSSALNQTDKDLLSKLAEAMLVMPVTNSVDVLKLLRSLIAIQLINKQTSNIKAWIDCLVQRFEVTKKIYEVYPPEFRKGEGSNTSTRLYWLFAFALSLFYLRSHKIKYLSTLLKVCDLLCSLPEEDLRDEIPECGVQLVLAAECVYIYKLAEKGRINAIS